MGRFLTGLLLVVLILVGIAFAFGYIKLNQTEDASLPRLEVKGGTMPEYKLNTPEVNVGTRNETVEVPVMEIKKPE